MVAGVVIAACLTTYILDINLFCKWGTAAGNESVAQAAACASRAEETGVAASTQTVQALASLQTAVPRPTAEMSADGRWVLVWRDTFDLPCVDLETWTEVERRDNYNGELQYFTPLNSYTQDGCLYLTAKKEKKDGKHYTSGMVETAYKRTFLYGRIEARMRLPQGKGLFPAFWLLSENYEVDVMEMIGSSPDIVYGVSHSSSGGRITKTYGTIEGIDTAQFHVYALEWEPDAMRWYIDGTLYYEIKENVSDEEMYIIFTLAVGGVWPGSPGKDTTFPCSMVIDEIALYRAAEPLKGA